MEAVSTPSGGEDKVHGAVYSLRVFVPPLCLRGNVLATLTVHIACGTDITGAGVIVRPWYQARPSVLSCSPGMLPAFPAHPGERDWLSSTSVESSKEWETRTKTDTQLCIKSNTFIQKICIK